jgi:hypothetical protein
MTELPDIDRMMLQIKSLDNNASLGFSEYTSQWYVDARIEMGGEGVLFGMTEHRSSPESAVMAYFSSLITVDLDHYLVTHAYDEKARRHWKWNGAAFTEVP